jgi:hypothetical protein
MPSLASWLKLLHVARAFWFVAGLVGRAIAIGHASRASDILIVTSDLAVAGQFERFMAIPGSVAVLVAGLLAAWVGRYPWFADGAYWLVTSLAIFAGLMVLVPTVFLPRGRIFEAALHEAQGRGTVTPELTAAFHDRAVAAARTTEALGVAAIIALMVLKPF